MIDYNKFINNSRAFLKKYIQENALESIVIGISGGIDSTISCAIASPVCNELNIPLIGRSLPTTTNKIEESKVAQLVGETFCYDFKTVNISEECQKLIHELELVEGKMTRLQEGNIKARVRMIYLRHLASIHKGVVLDNDNFTEWNLGFWTVGGDSPMDINLGLHHLWKTEIYELADYLLEQYDIEWKAFDDFETLEIAEKADIACAKYEALKASINLTPTDGNGVSNSDCEQFGLDNYEQVDDILKTMCYSSYPNSIRALNNGDQVKEYNRIINSYNDKGINKVMALHKNTEFKRKNLPICPTISELLE